jgi:hypothetical protein
MLGFLTKDSQSDIILDSGRLECDSSTIWLIQEDKRFESITIINTIEL